MYNFIYLLLAGASAEEIVYGGYKKIWPMWLKVCGGGEGGGGRYQKSFNKNRHCVTLFSPWISLCH